MDNGHYHPTEVVSDKIPALLSALVTPNEELKNLQDSNSLTKLMVMQEEVKTLPFGDVWNYYCKTQGVPQGADFFKEIEKYEKEVLLKR